MRGVLIVALLAGCTPQPSEITVHTGRPFLAAIDRGEGWEVLPDQEDLVFEVGGPFVLASACGSVDYVELNVWMATAEDADEWTMPCRQVAGEYHDVRVSVAPPRTASYWFSFAGHSGYGSSGDVLAQTTDVLAFEMNGDRRFVLERDYEIDRPREITIDFERDGRPFATHPVLKDLSAEVIETQLLVEMNGVSAFVYDTDADETSALVMPPEVLRPGDRQELYAVERFESQVRWAGGPFGRDPLPALLPDPIAEPTFTSAGDLPSVRYDDARDWTRRSLVAIRLSNSPNETRIDRIWYLDAWPGWVREAGVTGEIGFPDVTSIPGWDPDWQSVTPVTLCLSGRGEATKYAGVGYSSGFGGPFSWP